MAITISGENNNDKILATDGVIDSLSGFNIVGVITATTFTGDLTGDVTGNLTGNVTGNINNSTLLLQTGGNERVRIDSNGKVGVGVNPSAYPGKFVVSGDALICDRDIHSRVANSVANSDRGFKQDTDGVEKLHLYADNSSNIILEGNSGVEKFRIDSAGRVIIANGGNGGTADINADNFVVKNYNSSSSGGISILNADNQNSTLYFGNASDSKHAEIVWSDAANLFLIGSSNSGASLKFRTANQSDALIIDSAGLIKTLTRSAEVRRMILSGSPTNTAFNIEAHDGETGTSSGDVQGKLGLFYNDGSTLTNTACISFIRGSGAADGAMNFVTNQTERLRITSSGTVNIGGDYTSTTSRLRINSTSYPETTEYLAVFKAGVANGNRFKNRYIKIRNNYTGSIHGGVPIVWEANADGSNNKAYGAVVTEGNGDIRFLNAAATSEKAIGTDLLSTISEKLRIKSNGNVGIGTDNPTNNLQVNAASNESTISLFNAGTKKSAFQASNSFGTIIYSYDSEPLVFSVASGTSFSEKLRIANDGKVKIGSGTPQLALLHIAPTLYSINLQNDSNNKSRILFSKNSAGNDSRAWIEGNGELNGYISLAAGDNERLHIASDGNMGLGLTPAYSGLFGGAQRTFQIGGTSAPCLRITSSSSGQADLVVHAGNSGRRADIANMATNGAISIWTKPSSGSIAERIKISSAGYVTKPATPAFFATHTNTSSTHIGTLTYNTSGNGYYNNGGHLDTGSGQFHAPVDGIYHFHFHGFFQTGQSQIAFEVTITRKNSNGSGVVALTRQYGTRTQSTNTYGPSISMHCTTSLTAGQTVEVITAGLSFHGANGYYFGGHLLG